MKWFANMLFGKKMLSLVTVMALVLIEGQAAGQCEQKLLASDGMASDNLGQSVSMAGTEVAIVGAKNGDGLIANSGSAYIYRFNGVSWIEEQKLIASDGAAGDNFGRSVSISGTPGNEVAIVGAYFDDAPLSNSGSAYIYRFNGATWVEEQKLIASDRAASDFFGWSVSIDGASGNEVAIVGAYGNDDNFADSGSVYIYRYNGVTWVEEQKLLASDSAANDFFGQSVSISIIPGNEIAIVGAYGDDDSGTDSGSAYIYRFNGVNWIAEQKLLASDGAAGNQYSWSVSISGTSGNEVAIVGAYLDDFNGTDSGSAYIYRFNGAIWAEEAKLLASDGSTADTFGLSVSIISDPANEIAIVGAPLDSDNGSRSGSVYIYRFNGVIWEEDQKLLPFDGASQDLFGLSASISSDPGSEVILVGAYRDDDNGSGSGSAYIYELTVCPADTNCSGQVNVTDLLTLLGSWGPCPAPCVADTNSDGNVNVTDLLALLTAWGSCP